MGISVQSKPTSDFWFQHFNSNPIPSPLTNWLKDFFATATLQKQAQPVLPALPAKRPLKVEQIDLNTTDRQTIIKTAQVWERTANKKANEATGSESALFRDSASLGNWIASAVQYSNDRVFVCKDEALGETQAIAVVQNTVDENGKPALYVRLLATNPINIRSKVNENEHARVEGAGTAMIHHLAQVCLNENREKISLTALSSAMPFYKKVGFESYSYNSSSLFLKKEKFYFKTA